MRCPFCHNKGLVFLDETMQKLDNDDILSFLRKRKNILEEYVSVAVNHFFMIL